jgi:predicted Zn-dependent protease
LLNAFALWMWTSAAAAEPDALLDVMGAELARAKAALGEGGERPYFLSAEIIDTETITLRAEDGALHGVDRNRDRHVDVDVRLGDGQVDNTHPLRTGNEAVSTDGRSLPVEGSPEVIALDLWREIDASYRLAVERLAKVRTDRATLVDELPSWDLAPNDAPVVDVGEAVRLEFDEAAWSGVLRRVSSVLAEGGVVRDGAVRLTAAARTTRFASTEGTRIRHGRVDYTMSISLDAIAVDGSELDLSTIWMAARSEDLPTEAALTAEVAELRDLLGALTVAPDQEPYTGPVLLGGRAAGVFFHEVFGHRVEGHRLKRVDNAQTFTSKVGQAILPPFLDVLDDPTLPFAHGVALNGAYRYDNEGTPAKAVQLVDDGVLRGFLMGRSVIDADDRSNGHGRRAAGKFPVTRQGNLIVQPSKTVSEAELRRQLIDLAKKAGLAYGLYVDRIQGGFTFTERGTPNAFNVDVLVAYRVYVDGRPDELVRGVDLIGTPLVAFSRVVAAGPTPWVFNGVCGAESGWVPVSAISPTLLISQMETQRKQKQQSRPPLLPAPVEAK